MYPILLRGLEKVQSEMQEELMEAYELFDNRNKGVIDATGLTQSMKTLGYQVQPKQVQQMIAALDENNRNVITKDAFKKFMTARMDHRDDSEQLKSAFQYYDPMKRGKLVCRELQKMAEQLGEQKSQCPRMIKEADKDEDGGLNYEQFVRCIKKTSYQ